MRSLSFLFFCLLASSASGACGSYPTLIVGSGGAPTTGAGGGSGAGSGAASGVGSGAASGMGGGPAGEGGAPTSSTTPPSWNRSMKPPSDVEAAARRLACGYAAGALPVETQGVSYPNGDAIPVKHILVLMQENRSFDHYFTKLPESGQPDVEVAPSTYADPTGMGQDLQPYHQTRDCFADTNHSWAGSHQEYAGGKMDGFFAANQGYGGPVPHPYTDDLSGARALGYYDATDIPFYYWLANEFAIADHYHAALLGPTWPNRMYLYAGSSRGVTFNTVTNFDDQTGACTTDADCGSDAPAGACFDGTACKGTCTVDADCGIDAPVGTCDVAGGGVCQAIGRTIFDYMEQRGLDWKVYATGTPGYAIMVQAYARYHATHQQTLAQFYADAASGALPDVAFIDPELGTQAWDAQDEHPPSSPQPGQRFVAEVVQALTRSPAWSSSALFVTYDEHGGLFDHVVPPAACAPDDIAPVLSPGDPAAGFDQDGVRVPMMLVSPFARKHFVAHGVYDHTSIVRFIEARFIIPALTRRDANAEAPWEMFDFAAPPHATPPSFALPPVNQAALAACAKIWD
jgi:phospholipase C